MGPFRQVRLEMRWWWSRLRHKLVSILCFHRLVFQVKGALVEVRNPPRSEIMGNLVGRCFAEFRRLFTSIPAKSNPNRMVVATNTDREIRLQAIRAKIKSLKEEDLKQKHILEYLNSDSFKERISQKILSVTMGNLDNNQDGDQENRVKRLKEQQEILKKEDKRLQSELEHVESESNRLEEIIQQKQLNLQALRERVRQRQENKA